MTAPKIRIDSTVLTDLMSGGDSAPGQNVLRALAHQYELNISDVTRRETTRYAQEYDKDRFVNDILKSLDNRLDPNKNTQTNNLVAESRREAFHHTDPNYFPQNNAGERAIIEKWQPGDIIVSDDTFFRNQQANDRFTMRVRPDMTPELWTQMKSSVMSTHEFLNMAAVNGTIRLEDHQAIAARFPDKDYLSPDEITHRQTLIAEGHSPDAVHRMPREIDRNASRGVGVASAVVDVAEGNYGAAALDTAGVVAETKLGERILDGAVDALHHISPRQVFNGLAQGIKRTPFLGVAVTGRQILLRCTRVLYQRRGFAVREEKKPPIWRLSSNLALRLPKLCCIYLIINTLLLVSI